MFSHLFRRLFHTLHPSRAQLFGVMSVLGGVTLAVMLISAPLMLHFESLHPEANVKNLGDALWLTFMIVTTVGFGDFYPVSLGGRLMAVPLAACGIGLFGTLAGYLGSMILDRVVRAATTDMLHEQNSRIETLVSQNRQMAVAIKQISEENSELNRAIVALAKQNSALNQKIDADTNEILELLQQQHKL
uniref:Putative Ion transporter n=1 Tax=Magnetococcus massalia (strain MO-1) TaxID=451514 RepID=A0A1S7LH49_MAGMO|nr:putative Ion transporter [Candidatus Magnetococcus massalia]